MGVPASAPSRRLGALSGLARSSPYEGPWAFVPGRRVLGGLPPDSDLGVSPSSPPVRSRACQRAGLGFRSCSSLAAARADLPVPPNHSDSDHGRTGMPSVSASPGLQKHIAPGRGASESGSAFPLTSQQDGACLVQGYLPSNGARGPESAHCAHSFFGQARVRPKSGLLLGHWQYPGPEPSLTPDCHWHSIANVRRRSRAG